MKEWSFYDPETGVISPHRVTISHPGQLACNTPAGLVAIEGHHDPLSKRVVDGKVVDWQSPQPSPDHDWDGRRWNLKPEAQERVHQRRRAAAAIGELEGKPQQRAARELLLQIAAELKLDASRLQAVDDAIAAARPALKG